jgi:hypothetical protein
MLEGAEGARFVTQETPAPETAGRFKSSREILEYVRKRGGDPAVGDRVGWERAYRDLSDFNLTEALPFFEHESVNAHSTKRTDLRDLREIVFSIGTKTDMGDEGFPDLRVIGGALESFRDAHVFERQVARADADELKEIREEWNDDIIALRRGIIEPALRRAEYHVVELEKKLKEPATRGGRIKADLSAKLIDARTVRTTLLKHYLEPGR